MRLLIDTHYKRPRSPQDSHKETRNSYKDLRDQLRRRSDMTKLGKRSKMR